MKEQIIIKASQLFLNHGFKSVTMDDIAHEMAISKKTIYSFFKTKAELVAATTEYVFAQVSEKVDSICCEKCDVSPIHNLFHICDFMSEHLKQDNAPEYQLQKYYPQIAAALTDKKFKLITEGIIENLSRGIAKGLYRPDIHKEIIARIYFSSVSAISTSEVFRLPGYKLTQVMRTFILYHIRAIATPLGLEELNFYLKNIDTDDEN